MASYNIIVSPRASDSIRSFYRNVSKKYCHTYSYELMTKNITDAINSMYQIENGLQRRTPTINRWKGKGYLMANTKKVVLCLCHRCRHNSNRRCLSCSKYA